MGVGPFGSWEFTPPSTPVLCYKAVMLTGRLLQSLALSLALAGSAIVLSAQQQAPPAATTAEAARAFLEEANRELLRLVNASNRAGWTQGTYITVGYRADLGRGERRARERRDPLCEGGAPLRRRDAAGGRAPPVRRAEELADDVGAAGSEGGGRAHAPGRVDGGRRTAAASTARRARPARSASTSRRSPSSWRTAGTRSGCRRSGKGGTRSPCR